jgi:plasmid stabilization system protein ParE
MKLVWTVETRKRLIEIEDFIAQDSPFNAARFIDQMRENRPAQSDRTTEVKT